MSLKDRLARLERLGLLKAGGGGSETGARGEEPEIEVPEEPQPWVAESEVRRHLYPPHHRHGLLPLGGLREKEASHLAWVTREVSTPESWEHVLFLDTETTGLGHGTGTYVFLAGLAYFRGNELHLEQHFLPSPAREHEFLDRLLDCLGGFTHLVTYNGKGFDWPLLSSRLVLARKADRWRPRAHYDLLPAARRLWREALPSLTLGSLENNVLGVQRSGDVPGAEIPGLYFAYLQSGRTSFLEDVFEHNRLDVLSMVTLASHLCHLAAGPEREDSPDHPHPPVGTTEEAGLARLASRQGEFDRARTHYRAALAGAQDGAPRRRVKRELSLVLKRERRWDEAAALWREMCAESSGPFAPVFPFVELAKYLEHREKDFASALETVDRARAILEERRRLLRSEDRRATGNGGATLSDGPLQPSRVPDRTDQLRQELEHRRRRLLRRLAGRSGAQEGQ